MSSSSSRAERRRRQRRGYLWQLPTGERSGAEEDRLLEDLVRGASVPLPGDSPGALARLMSLLDNADTALSLAELVPLFERLLAASSTASSAASAVSFGSAVLFPVQGMLELNRAHQSSQRLWAAQALIYGYTAWAFRQQFPRGSAATRGFASRSFARDPQLREAYDKIWNTYPWLSARRIGALLVQHGLAESSVRATLQDLGRGSPQALCQRLLRAFEPVFAGSLRPFWKSYYAIVYPG